MKDPKYDTTLYNHKNIGSKDKPLISNEEFKQLFERVSAGEHELVKIYTELYSIEPKQLKSLLDIVEKRIL